MKKAFYFFNLLLVRGVPDANFRHEFASNPAAESVRVRYRTFIFFFGLGPLLVALLLDALSLITHFGLHGPVWIWLWLMVNPVVMLGPDLENGFVRVVMKRRAKLAARGAPPTAEKLLWFFLPSETCDEAIDDLNAKFEARKAKFGTSWARWWYCWQTARSLSPSFDLLIERLIKWGALGWIGRHL